MGYNGGAEGGWGERGRVDARLFRIRARGPEGKGINTGIESAERN